jgi:hypothetical protein
VVRFSFCFVVASGAISIAIASVACGGSDESKMTQAWTPDESEGSAAASSGDDEDDSDPSVSTTSNPTGTPMPCDDVCESPPTDCQLAPGTCEDGLCNYPSALAGTPCTSGCASTGFCDAAGTCICADSCADTCVGGPNMTAACNDVGECVRTCTAPFDDCDGDPANGCEVPVGVAHQCDSNGLNPDGGCWTAYCGDMQAAGVVSFGTYHCVDCSTCGAIDGGQCHWCNHDSGTWFPAEACGCGEYLDAVCSPA